MTVSQTQAIVNALHNLVEFTDYQSQPVIITSEQKRQIASGVMQMMIDGEVALSDAARARHIKPDGCTKSLFKYVRSTVDDTLRKNKKVNGNIKFTNKNPGSRTDETMKNLLALQSTYEANSEEYKTVGEAIEKRAAELKAEKAKKEGKTVEINIEALSPELRAALGL